MAKAVATSNLPQSLKMNVFHDDNALRWIWEEHEDQLDLLQVAVLAAAFLLLTLPYATSCMDGRSNGGQIYCAAGQGRVVKRVEIPPWKVGQPPSSESLEAGNSRFYA
jgi:hypothetical protein